MISVALTEPGPLGMTVGSFHLQNPPGDYTMIKKIAPHSQAEKAGVLEGDIVGARYEEAKQWGQGPRPVAFCLFRDPSKDKARGSEDVTKRTAAISFSATTGISPNDVQAKTPALKSTSKATTMGRQVDKNITVDASMTNAGTADASMNLLQEDQQAAVVLAHQLATTLLPAESTVTSSNTTLSVTQPSFPPQDDTIVPFCKACQKSNGSSRAHHALCPKHPHFDNSGAMEKLQLIRRGVQSGCAACKHFYQNGRVVDSSIAHIDNCPRRKQPLRQNGEILSVPSVENSQGGTTTSKATTSKARSKNGATSKKPSSDSTATVNKETSASSKAQAGKKKGTVKKTTGRRKSSGPRELSQSATITSSNTQEVDNGHHQFTQETAALTTVSSGIRRKRKKNIYEYESDSESEGDTYGKENTRPSSKRTAPKRSKIIEKGSPVPLVVDTSSRKNHLATPAPKKQTKNGSKANVDRQLKPNWVSCANPWGPSGYQEGDVVLVTPSGGFTHHETIYGGDRFTVSPFSADSDYDATHRTPSEGFDVILLTRDPNAEHPWGFTCRRHEFGGACLVASIDPLSPAASAVRITGAR